MAKYSDLEYLKLSKWGKFGYKLGNFFISIPLGIGHFFQKIGKGIAAGVKAFGRECADVVTTFKNGDAVTKGTFLIMGLGNFARGQVLRGLLFLLFELVFIVYMIVSGGYWLSMLPSLGVQGPSVEYDAVLDTYVTTYHDNSFKILLYGVLTLVITVIAVIVWITSIYSGEDARQRKLAGRKVYTLKDDIVSLFDSHIVRLFLFLPMIGIIIFTITPLIYMILMAFTNYDSEHQPPGHLFSWVGLENFRSILDAGGKLGSTFLPILGWTLIWAVIACFSCYFGGMILAILINSKGVKFKKFWRTIFIFAMAIPAFVSLLVISTMLGKNGIMNVLLQNWGFTTGPLPFLTNAAWARGTVIVVNMWLGIPITMLMVSGILMNIPAELYESANLDGANPVQAFISITFLHCSLLPHSAAIRTLRPASGKLH